MIHTEQLGPYALTWPEGVFPLGGDALALGEFATVKRNWKVCDLGTGSGALLLMLSGRMDRLELFGIEQDELSAQTARENLEANELEGQILQGDLREDLLPPGSMDLVVSNPPYFPVGTGASAGPFRSEERCTLEQLCAQSARLLKNGGRFALCHRPERLCDVLCALRTYGIEPKRMQLVAHGPAHPPSLVLVEGVRQGKPGLEILPVQFTASTAPEAAGI